MQGAASLVGGRTQLVSVSVGVFVAVFVVTCYHVVMSRPVMDRGSVRVQFSASLSLPDGPDAPASAASLVSGSEPAREALRAEGYPLNKVWVGFPVNRTMLMALAFPPKIPKRLYPEQSLTPPPPRALYPALMRADSVFSTEPAEQEKWEKLLATGPCTRTIPWARVVEYQTHQLCVKKTLRLSFVRGELRFAYYILSDINLHRIYCGLWLIHMTALRAAARGRPLPDFEVNLNPEDCNFRNSPAHKQYADAGPILSNHKCGPRDPSVSVPLSLHDQYGYGSGGMSLQRYASRQADQASWWTGTWDDKSNSAFFSAGGGATTRGYRKGIFQNRSPFLTAIAHGVDLNKQAKYRGQVYAFGHCGWSRRIHELAVMESVVFMEDSPCHEFIHHVFDPWVDFVPVAMNFSDLAQRAEAQLKDVEGSRRMASQWFAKGKEALSLGCVLDYLDLLLRRLAQLLKFKPHYHDDWPLFHSKTTPKDILSPAAKLNISTCSEPIFGVGYRKQAIGS